MLNIPTFNDRDYIGINGVGIKQLTHPHFEEWFRYIIDVYQPPQGMIGVFIPCAAVKPYYNSPIHRAFNKIIDSYPTHKIVISNAGIVPYEFSTYYPFDSYDWNPYHETTEIKEKYMQITAERLVSFLNKHSKRYKGFVSYLTPDSEDFVALDIASQIADINIIHVEVTNHKLSDSSDYDLALIFEDNLKKLDNTLKEFHHY